MTDDELRELTELEAIQAARRVASPAPRVAGTERRTALSHDSDGGRDAEATARVSRQRYLDELTMSQRQHREAHQNWLSNHPYFEN